MVRGHVTCSRVDMDEACLKGLLHVLCNVLRSHRRQDVNRVIRTAQGVSGLTVPFHLVPVPKARAGNCGLPIRDGMEIDGGIRTLVPSLRTTVSKGMARDMRKEGRAEWWGRCSYDQTGSVWRMCE
jgi:hypothetical protein